MLKPIRGKNIAKKLDAISKRDAELFNRVIIRDNLAPKTLKTSFKIRKTPAYLGVLEGSVEIYSPYYWAKSYHDGHGTIYPRKRKVLAFYKNPKNDPRLAGLPNKYPQKKSEVKSLFQVASKEQIKQDAQAGRLIFSKFSRPWRGNKFLDKAAGKYVSDRRKQKDLADYAEAHLTGFMDFTVDQLFLAYGIRKTRNATDKIYKIKAVVSSKKGQNIK